MTRGKHGYKYQKLCHNPSPLPRGREGSLTAKSPNLSAKKIWYSLTVHIRFQIYKQNFSNLCFVLRSNLQRIMQIPRNSPQISRTIYRYIMFQMPALAENSLKFQRIVQIPHNSPTTSVNHAKFVPFANSLYIMFQMPDQWQRTH